MPETSKPQLAMLAAVAMGAGFGIGGLVSRGTADAPGSANAPTPHVQPAGKPLDFKAHSDQERAYRAQHPNAVGLLSGEVAPGVQVTTGVNVELGKRPAGVKAVGEAWTIDAVSFEDRASTTWIEVKATNTGKEPARFFGMVEVP